ncbi:MAG: NFACT family protein [Armatimonadetes bacterium]|nr:NFACT family protein [Armatimonadota bacterium]
MLRQESQGTKPVFDSLCLACVVHENHGLPGAKVQKIWAVDPSTIAFELYQRQVFHLIASFDAQLARIVTSGHRPEKLDEQPQFVLELRRRLLDSRIAGFAQVGFDRIAEIEFAHEDESHTLICELMGKHSNLILVDAEEKMVAAGKWLGSSKSRRPILPGHEYQPPPLEPRPSLLKARPGDDLRDFEGASPFLIKLIQSAQGPSLAQVQAAIQAKKFEPSHTSNIAYPIDISPLIPEARPASGYDAVAATIFENYRRERIFESRRGSLLGQLRRTQLAREVALSELEQAADTAARARELQVRGELLLAYARSVHPGTDTAKVYDYEGAELEIEIHPDLDAKANAQKYFDRAKKAKASAVHVQEQLHRIHEDYRILCDTILEVERASMPIQLERAERTSDQRRWLHRQQIPADKPEDRPYQGKAIRELLGPGGFKVLYGDNAEANDFLTMRVARPNDYWLHVRGAPSCHVVIQTSNKPERVQPDTLTFAALVAARHSPAKHSNYVTVDYTLKKYVRKPKGANSGTAVYTHEKSVHVDPTAARD